jgi:hypothetical protein
MTRRTHPIPPAFIAIGLLTAVVSARPAAAQGAYFGGAYSWSTVDVRHVDASLFDNRASAYKLFAGLEYGNFFGVEGAWLNFGTFDANKLEGFDESPGKAKLDGWGVAITGRLPLARWLTVYGKAGYFSWDSKITGTGDLLHQVGDRAKSGEDPFYGAGVRLSSGKLSLIAEWEHYPRGNEIDSDLVTLGLRLYF